MPGNKRLRRSKKMPALARAQRVTVDASKVGFDWPEVEPVMNKLEEELNELKSAMTSGNQARIRAEMGDALLSLVNLSRFLNVEAEDALSEAVERFLRRFAYVQTQIQNQGRSLTDATLKEMDAFWEEAKKTERRKQP
jgi:tetrapyrrole methylase family protein/MazG family protein